MINAQSSWSNRPESAMEANDVETINVDQGATLPASPAKEKDRAKDRDSEGFISPPKHLPRKAPKANPLSQIKDIPTIDSNPDVDVNTLDPEHVKVKKKSPHT
ncbi:hypothetical protein NPIL_593371 [Nephila pilipes]|uniref:Uncharacterized protein n=1 Tax=Nephila pilipes TaxID=299642 RepID=A0A8X6ULW7_NEPPI|nr:hypothetical protein NPIL_593371 [Nephila pilipes]